MFFDHITPIDGRALAEAFVATGFRVELNIPRFLPYTPRAGWRAHPALVRLYLKVRLAWRFLGAQAFMVGAPAGDARSRGLLGQPYGPDTACCCATRSVRYSRPSCTAWVTHGMTSSSISSRDVVHSNPRTRLLFSTSGTRFCTSYS